MALLFSFLIAALQIFQDLHQFYYNNQDITIHYTQLKIEPLTTISINPPVQLLINNELQVVNALTSNRLGEVYFRVPIFHDDNVYLPPLQIVYNNQSTLLYLDAHAHLAISNHRFDNNTLEHKLQQIAALSWSQISKHVLKVDISGLPKFSANIADPLQQLWQWIKNEFKKALKKITDIIILVRSAFDFNALKTNRIILWHYLQLVYQYDMDLITNIQFKDPSVDTELSPPQQPQTGPINEHKTDIFKNLLFGSFVESMHDIHSQSPSDLINNYNMTSSGLKLLLQHPTITTFLANRTDLHAFDDFSLIDHRNQTTLNKLVDIIINVVSKIWDGIKGVTLGLFNAITTALKPLAKVFANIQFNIAKMPLIIPGITTWISQQLNDKLRLIDFFLLPLSAKINLYFNKNNIKFTDQDQYAILNCKLFTDLQYLPQETLLKLHWADRFMISFGFSFQIPFLALKSIPVVNWLNPLWNSASFILAVLSAPHNIFNPVANPQDVRLHIARLFNSFLTFIPNPFIFYPNIVGIVLQVAVYKIPYSIMRTQRIIARTLKSLPKTYLKKKLMLGMHDSVDALRIGSQFFQLLPYGGSAINYVALSITTSLSDVIINYGIQWRTRLAF